MQIQVTIVQIGQSGQDSDNKVVWPTDMLAKS